MAAVAALALAASASALVGGSPDNGKHPYVGMALTPAPDGSGFELCTGSLVSPTVFVTAAHCFIPGQPTFVVMAEDALGALNQYGLGAAVPGAGVPYPGWGAVGKGLSKSDRNDFGVVLLSQPISEPSYAALPSLGYDDTLPNNQQVDVLGYGVQQAPDQGAGTRRVATVKIIPGGGVTGDTFLKVSGGVTCFGDSGGPVLKAGTNQLVAVNSYGPSATCNAVAYAQRVDTSAALGFIKGFLH